MVLSSTQCFNYLLLALSKEAEYTVHIDYTLNYISFIGFNWRAVQRLNFDEVMFDILCYGPTCQPLLSAGQQVSVNIDKLIFFTVLYSFCFALFYFANCK